jgi:hypothetical protein
VLRSLALVVAVGAIAVGIASGAARVVGGSAIQVQAAPWTVFVQSTIGNLRLSCTGSVIDASHVVTAAHCMFDDLGHPVSAANVTVKAGISNFSAPLPTDAEQDRTATAVRIHPGYLSSQPGHPDDVAVIALSSPLDLSGPAVQAVALPTPGLTFPAGAKAGLAGFGQQTANVQSAGPLLWMTPTVDDQGVCSPDGVKQGLTPYNGITLCASTPSSAVCNGDSGSGLVTSGSTPVLIGVASSTIGCDAGSRGVFSYVGAPEILQFLQGSDAPPTAPRLTSATFLRVKWDPPLVVGNTLTCSTGGWVGNGQQNTYTFIDDADGQELGTASGPVGKYLISAGDAGRKIVCDVAVTNDGGTTIAETTATPTVKPAPPVRILQVKPLTGIRGRGVSLRVVLQTPLGVWGSYSVCVTPPKSVAGKLCHSATNPQGLAGTFPFEFDFRIKPTAPLGTTKVAIGAVAGASQTTGVVPLTISKS